MSFVQKLLKSATWYSESGSGFLGLWHSPLAIGPMDMAGSIYHIRSIRRRRLLKFHACVPEVTNWVIEDRCQFLLANRISVQLDCFVAS